MLLLFPFSGQPAGRSPGVDPGRRGSCQTCVRGETKSRQCQGLTRPLVARLAEPSPEAGAWLGRCACQDDLPAAPLAHRRSPRQALEASERSGSSCVMVITIRRCKESKHRSTLHFFLFAENKMVNRVWFIFDPVGEVFKRQEPQSVRHECHQAEYPSTKREDEKS